MKELPIPTKVRIGFQGKAESTALMVSLACRRDEHRDCDGFHHWAEKELDGPAGPRCPCACHLFEREQEERKREELESLSQQIAKKRKEFEALSSSLRTNWGQRKPRKRRK